MSRLQMRSPPATDTTARVLLVEDHTAIRNLLASYIAAMPGFVVVGEVDQVDDAVQLTNRARPDVVVLDWMLPGGLGRDFLHQLPETRRPRVLVFSANTTELAVREALGAGATGYIEKTAPFSEFTLALRSVAAGDSYFGPAVLKTVHRLVRNPNQIEARTELSPRQRDVLRHVAQGMSSKEIGALLGLSVRTVENHRAAILRRTALRSVAELTLLAMQLGLIETPVVSERA